MHMRGQDERRFAVRLSHQQNYQFLSQASEDGEPHGEPFRSDEPDPVGDNAGPATPALLGAALGHCLSAALLEALKFTDAKVLGCETEAVAIVAPNEEKLPRIKRVEVTIRPRIQELTPRAEKTEQRFERHCTVTSSVKAGVDVHVNVDWQVEAPAEEAIGERTASR